MAGNHHVNKASPWQHLLQMTSPPQVRQQLVAVQLPTPHVRRLQTAPWTSFRGLNPFIPASPASPERAIQRRLQTKTSGIPSQGPLPKKRQVANTNYAQTEVNQPRRTRETSAGQSLVVSGESITSGGLSKKQLKVPTIKYMHPQHWTSPPSQGGFKYCDLGVTTQGNLCR